MKNDAALLLWFILITIVIYSPNSICQSAVGRHLAGGSADWGEAIDRLHLTLLL